MREYKFRGMFYNSFDDKWEWKYGYFCGCPHCSGEDEIYGFEYQGMINSIDGSYGNCRVKNVGQFTGLTDKNGKEVYEKDIILAYILHENGKERYEKLLCKSYDNLQDLSWVCEDGSGAYHLGFVYCNPEYKLCSPLVEFEIIGNLYENPDLWGGAK